MNSILVQVFAEGLDENGKWQEIARSVGVAPTVNWRAVRGYSKGRMRRVTDEVMEIDLKSLEETSDEAKSGSESNGA